MNPTRLALSCCVAVLLGATPRPALAAQPESGQKSSVGSKVTEVLKEFEALEREHAVLQGELADAKTEIEQLKVKRNELEELKRSLGKAQRDAEQLNAEKAQASEKAAKHMEDMNTRITQRDEQLQKLRDIHATLDKQYAALEASHKDLETRFKDSERNGTALADQVAKIQAALTAAQDQAETEFTTLQQQAQETQSRLTLELEQTRAKEQHAAKELEALHNTQLELQERLVAAQEKGISLDTGLADAQKAKAELQGALNERTLQLEEARKQNQELQQAFDSMKGDLAATGSSLADIQKDRANLQEQLRVAKDTQATFTGQLKDLQTVSVEREKLQLALNEREAQVVKLQGEVGSVTRDLETAKRQLQAIEAEGQEHTEQMRIDQKGLEWRVESLEKELQDARAAETRLQVDLESRTKNGTEQENLHGQLAKKLAERESQLKQAESVIKLLQGPQGGLESPEAPVSYEPIPGVGSPSAMPSVSDRQPEAADLSVPEAQVTGEDHPIKIYQVNEELHFVVFSMEGMGWAKPGTRLLLVSQNEPVAAVQLTELDSAGFAVAQIIQTIDAGKQIRKGDLLFARLLLSPVGQ